MHERRGRRNAFGRYSRLEVKVRDFQNGLSRSITWRFANISVAPVYLLQVHGFGGGVRNECNEHQGEKLPRTNLNLQAGNVIFLWP